MKADIVYGKGKEQEYHKKQNRTYNGISVERRKDTWFTEINITLYFSYIWQVFCLELYMLILSAQSM